MPLSGSTTMVPESFAVIITAIRQPGGIRTARAVVSAWSTLGAVTDDATAIARLSVRVFREELANVKLLNRERRRNAATTLYNLVNGINDRKSAYLECYTDMLDRIEYRDDTTRERWTVGDFGVLESRILMRKTVFG